MIGEKLYEDETQINESIRIMEECLFSPKFLCFTTYLSIIFIILYYPLMSNFLHEKKFYLLLGMSLFCKNFDIGGFSVL